MNRLSNKKMQHAAAHPWMKPELLGRLQTEIDAACDEMERMKVTKPSPELVGQMTNRIYGNLRRDFPELDRYSRVYDKGIQSAALDPVSLYGVHIQQGGFFAGLIALLLLAGFFGRRRFRGRY